MCYDYVHTLFKAFTALSSYAIVHLFPSQWTPSVQLTIVKMPPYWLALGTQQRVGPSTEVTPSQSWHSIKKLKDKKNSQGSIS